MGFCERVPFASLIGTCFVAAGTAVFVGGTLLGWDATIDFMKDYSEEATEDERTKRVKDIEDVLDPVCYGLAVLMGLLCFVLLVLGFFTFSKDQVWGGGRGLLGANIAFSIITSVVFVMWTGILAVITVPLAYLYTLYHFTQEWGVGGSAQLKIDLRYFLLVPDHYAETYWELTLADYEIAHEQIEDDMIHFYLLAWAGAFLTVWGLAIYLVALAGAVGRGLENRKAETYLYKRNLEQRQLDNMARVTDKFQM